MKKWEQANIPEIKEKRAKDRELFYGKFESEFLLIP